MPTVSQWMTTDVDGQMLNVDCAGVQKACLKGSRQAQLKGTQWEEELRGMWWEKLSVEDEWFQSFEQIQHAHAWTLGQGY
jgi:hypothetical protein